MASFGASESEPEEEEARVSDVGNADASQEVHQTAPQEMPTETSSEQTVPNTTDSHDADSSQDLHQTTPQAMPDEMSSEQTVPNTTNSYDADASQDLHQTTLQAMPDEHETQAIVEELGNVITPYGDVLSPMVLISRNEIQDQMREWLVEMTEVYASSFYERFPGYTFNTLRRIWYHTKAALHNEGHDQLAVLRG
jgi:hypothetical protein